MSVVHAQCMPLLTTVCRCGAVVLRCTAGYTDGRKYPVCLKKGVWDDVVKITCKPCPKDCSKCDSKGACTACKDPVSD